MSLYWRLQLMRGASVAKSLGEALSGSWGEPWPKKLAAIARAGNDLVNVNEWAMGRLLRGEGYSEYTGPVRAYLVALPYADLVSGAFGSVSFYPDAETSAVIRFQPSGTNSYPTYAVKEGVDPTELVRKALWKGWPVARVVQAGTSWDSKFSLIGANPPGAYVGDPSVESMVESIVRVPSPDGTRSVLIIGEAGNGKTTAARRIVETIVGDGVLVIPSDCLYAAMNNADALIALRPRAVILDDVPLESSKAMLSFFESVRGHLELVVSTFMADKASIDRQGQGADFWPGMRPGRVDRIIRLMAPDRAKATAILIGYLGSTPSDAVLDLVAGFSGAHLRELALRIQGGLDGLQEAEQLRRTLEATPAPGVVVAGGPKSDPDTSEG